MLQVSLQYSDQEGITTRKLPISLYMQRAEQGTFKQILTVNQVFDILLKYQVRYLLELKAFNRTE